MSNKMKAAAVGFFTDEITLIIQGLNTFVSQDANDLETAEDLLTRFEASPGFEMNRHTNRISFTIAWCPTCEKNVTGKSIRPPIGRCPECKGDDLEDSHEIFIEVDKRERIFVWDVVKKSLKGERTPMLTRKVGRIAEALGKTDEFKTLVAPKEKRKEDAGPEAASGPEAVAGAPAETVAKA